MSSVKYKCCKDCVDRKPACWSSCDKYKKLKRDIEAAKEKKKVSDINSYIDSRRSYLHVVNAFDTRKKEDNE